MNAIIIKQNLFMFFLVLIVEFFIFFVIKVEEFTFHSFCSPITETQCYYGLEFHFFYLKKWFDIFLLVHILLLDYDFLSVHDVDASSWMLDLSALQVIVN